MLTQQMVTKSIKYNGLQLLRTIFPSGYYRFHVCSKYEDKNTVFCLSIVDQFVDDG